MQCIELVSFPSQDSGHAIGEELIESFILHTQAELVVKTRWCELLKPEQNKPLP